MYSIFDFSTDFIQLKSRPTALINFAGRLYAFDESHIYKINQQNLAIEDIYEGIGCLSKDSIIVTEYGMFLLIKTEHIYMMELILKNIIYYRRWW